MKKFVLKFLKLTLKFFLILVAIVVIINCISLFLNRTNYGQKIALSSYKKIGTFRFKRLAKLKFKNKLSHTVLEENLDQVKKIVSQYRSEDKVGAINTKDFAGISALQIAVWLGNKEIIEYLLENGANIESKNDRGETILLDFLWNPLPVYDQVLLPIATLHGWSRIMDVDTDFFDSFLRLLQYYFLNLLKIQVPKGRMPWEYTVLGESRPWDILKFLVNKGANVNVHSRRMPAILVAIMADNLKLAKFLVKNGASVKADKFSVLQFARSSDLAKFLLEKGADVKAVDKRGNAPLHFAVRKGNVKIIELFLKEGADINRPNNKQVTPLGMGKFNAVSFLIENYGADITSENITNTFGYACKKGNLDLVTYILEKRKKDISKKKIPLFLEETKKTMQKTLSSLNKQLQEEKEEGVKTYHLITYIRGEEEKDLEDQIKDVTMRYSKIVGLLKNLEASL